MTLVGVTEANRVYDAAGSCTWARLLVDNGELIAFVRGLRRFVRRLGEEAADPYWKPVLRRFRRIRYELTSLPLPFSHPLLDLEGAAEDLRRKLRTCSALYPSFEAAAAGLTSAVQELARNDANPLGEAIVTLLADAGFNDPRDAVLLRNRGFGEGVRAHLRQRGVRVRTVNPEDLIGRMAASTLIAIGPSSWFPHHVITAPRASELVFLHYRWIRDEEPRAGLLDTLSHRTRSVTLHTASLPPQVEDAFDPAELLPVIDWGGIAGSGSSVNVETEDAEVLPANLYLLAGGFAVYLEAEDSYQIYGFDLSADVEERVRRVPAARVIPGMYLVLRREGGGDYVRVMADRILRERAPALRSLQRDWKDRLRREVRNSSGADVARRLGRFGTDTPSEMNVRYWCSYDSIATGKFVDFLAIMRLVGLDERAKELWEAMSHIRRAHLAAGQHVRRLLEDRVEQADLATLAESGVMDFTLEDGSGRLTVFRVEARAPEQFKIPRGQLRHPFTVERDLWQG